VSEGKNSQTAFAKTVISASAGWLPITTRQLRAPPTAGSQLIRSTNSRNIGHAAGTQEFYDLHGCPTAEDFL
jgi:hypothetical protein